MNAFSSWPPDSRHPAVTSANSKSSEVSISLLIPQVKVHLVTNFLTMIYT
jgi:hypothetical protein